MITEIDLPQRVPFDNERTTIRGLNRVSFFFGPNGSGKTTISRLIAEEACRGDSAGLRWDSSGAMKTYVYNRDFIKKNFAEDSTVQGVFTIGEEAVDAQNKIAGLTERLEQNDEKRSKAITRLDEAKNELTTITDGIRDACWSVRTELPEHVRKVWAGSGRKEPLRDALLQRIASLKPTDDQPVLEDIEQRIKLVFDDSVTTVNDIPEITFEELIGFETNPILQKKIVGKEDLPIGELIKKLGNSDWVAQGLSYTTEGDRCPFCQEHTLTDKLKAELDDFFDESYEHDKVELQRAAKLYAECSDGIVSAISGILATHADFVDAPAMKAQLATLKKTLQTNKERLNKKLSEPSIPISLDGVADICTDITALLKSAAKAVAQHNEMVNNRSEQQNKVIEDLWVYATIAAKPRVVAFDESLANAKKKIAGLEKRIQELDETIGAAIEELTQAERRLTNVKETADEINKLLQRLGFTNFKLAVTSDNRYRIVRMDDTPVNDTLSEGENSFLTFLYFYYLMDGSQESTGATEKRIVVIDDPVSSMDADVLFVASSLVRKLAKDARDGNGKIEQLIVLTHNITFHREVTFVRAGEGDSKTTYFAIRKSVGHSAIEQCDNNPVSSTYELLWEDFCRDDCSALTAQNVARRITETFFKLVGGPEPDEIISNMESPDREIARSYMSWANAGSHNPIDDETYHNTRENIEVYRRVLKTIFESAGYQKHYDEMTSRYTAIAP